MKNNSYALYVARRLPKKPVSDSLCDELLTIAEISRIVRSEKSQVATRNLMNDPDFIPDVLLYADLLAMGR